MSFNDLWKKEADLKKTAEAKPPKPQADTEETPKAPVRSQD
jgi:hypothetical protein